MPTFGIVLGFWLLDIVALAALQGHFFHLSRMIFIIMLIEGALGPAIMAAFCCALMSSMLTGHPVDELAHLMLIAALATLLKSYTLTTPFAKALLGAGLMMLFFIEPQGYILLQGVAHSAITGILIYYIS